MELNWTQEAAGPVTLVHARLRNERATDRRVRLRNRLDGPVLPPRRHGVPEAGWDREGTTAVVPAGESVALGYACPAPEADPPVVVDDVTAADAPASDDTPETAVRELGDHRPPRAVLGGERADPAIDADDDESRSEPPDGDPPTGDLVTETPEATSLPDGVAARLDRPRTRIRTAEALTAVGVVEATTLVDANGGLRGVESLAAELDTDARELRALARTARALADRAAAAAPPVEDLRRLS
ncbi:MULTISPECIES: DUF7857 domain-containing protein [Halolamina]|uniref:DUF8080 domain-containing protein n=1 Tax=Halolamina pelagica TaxID=699431 RepID=A0A1I5SAL4_9EURY|nr:MULTISPECIES: hypothetical protein [Halolamina]NHX37147.1 hypothetical protein [Halolamina sp. R1-12]SFP67804.1 hypothetical protein SAMN05216277_10628 [Halolamina pelagica]